jgi:aminoglycoside phosphotransferase (APT) family kinase protein
MDSGRPRGVVIGRGRYADVFNWDDGQVVKLFHQGLPEHLAKREFIATRVLYEAGLPVPEVFGVVTVQGRNGLVLEKVEGPSMQERLSIDPRPRMDVVTKYARVLAELHSAIHEHEMPRLPMQRQRLVEDISRARRLDDGTRDQVLELLDDLPDGTATCHDDFHPRNVIMSPRGPVVIDCLTASMGNPSADVARSLLVMEAGQEWDSARVREMRRHFRSSYLHKVCFLGHLWPEEVRQWRVPIAAARLGEGFPGEEDWLLHLIGQGLKRR